jgi:hypothetical protein
MSQSTERLIHYVRNADAGEIRERLHTEATRRGHAQQTMYAGAGGLLGGLLGSFRGPGGAALGGFLGALLGALFGWRRDQRRIDMRLPAPRRDELDVPRSRLRPRVEVEREYVDVHYREL